MYIVVGRIVLIKMDGNNPIDNKKKQEKRKFARNIKPPQFLALGFLGLIIIGTLLLSLPVSWNPGVKVGFLDALFTATSAVCVTGLAVVDTANTYSTFGQIVVMLLIQFGGLGFMTAAVVTSLLFGRRITVKDRMVIKESLGPSAAKDVAGVILRIVRLTLVIELTGALLLSVAWLGQFGPRAFYLGLFHSVSAFNNCGLDLMGDFQSLAQYTTAPFILAVITLLVFFGSIGYPVIGELLRFRKKGRLSINTRIVLTVTFILLAVGFFGMLLLESGNPSTFGGLNLKDKLFNAMFYSVVPRTAGFSTLDTANLSQASLFLFIILMAIGASPGSTAGGIKTTTIAVIMSARWADIRGRKQPVMFKRTIDSDTVVRADTILVLYIVLIAAATLVLTVSEDTLFMRALFEVVSAAATVGFSTGITPDLTPIGKLTLIFTMYTGRLGPLTLAYAVAKKGKRLYDYPKEDIRLS